MFTGAGNTRLSSDISATLVRKYNEHEDDILAHTGRRDGLLNSTSSEWISDQHMPTVKKNWLLPRLRAIWRDLW